MVKIVFNGEKLSVEANLTLWAFLESKKMAHQTGFAVAINQQVIPKSKWPETFLKAQDNLLVVMATQGG